MLFQLIHSQVCLAAVCLRKNNRVKCARPSSSPLCLRKQRNKNHFKIRYNIASLICLRFRMQTNHFYEQKIVFQGKIYSHFVSFAMYRGGVAVQYLPLATELILMMGVHLITVRCRSNGKHVRKLFASASLNVSSFVFERNYRVKQRIQSFQ